MSTYTQILYQIVFGSKDNTEFLDSENQGFLFGYIVGILRKRECHPYQVEGYGNQEEHHRKISFKEELTELLNENMVQFKEKYLLV